MQQRWGTDGAAPQAGDHTASPSSFKTTEPIGNKKAGPGAGEEKRLR
ncbi:hypothetical protein SynNOUM97013_02366 [Synechococcus sp. NOUM97013]|nr:hypothetical protein SynNOUM97013_02366 [Synechococcus sp. NOUM97013]